MQKVMHNWIVDNVNRLSMGDVVGCLLMSVKIVGF